MRNAAVAFALVLWAAGCVPSCGDTSIPLPVEEGGDAGPDAGGVGGPDGGGTPDAGSTPDAGGTPDAGTIALVACTTLSEPALACTAPGECCSNDCVNGSCKAVCRADGQACTAATDCCSLACNGGVCGGTICTQFGQDCTSASQCCSGVCAIKCRDASPVSQTCRRPGERCSGGGLPGSGCCPGSLCLRQGTASEHCGLPVPSDICLANGAACSSSGDCCGGGCSGAGACCVATGKACSADVECCVGTCTAGACSG
ncbi:MAG TPA: hypothetical protein VFP65_29935 [Anaeromyxobacteraceae bacterium]|nr:hypothetical protein [Anaeromyxobacteraceae bacterium]